MKYIKKITAKDTDKLNELIERIEQSMVNKKWWLPIDEISRSHFLDDDWGYFIGLFDEEKLVAASSLFYNQHEYGSSMKLLQAQSGPFAEIGRCMVLPEYRGNNYLYSLNVKLCEKAKEKGISTIIVTIHPDNTPSKKSFFKMGAEYRCSTIKCGDYPRDIYTISVDKK